MKSSPKQPRQWTCVFTGSKTGKPKANFVYTGGPVNSIEVITSQNITLPHPLEGCRSSTEQINQLITRSH
eukprot:CCRYP_002597-RB/>CCRYP_002597-RB protein AED:0.56 eAED:0.47 QI:0/-1/0/1/-1/0/1/0/69